MNADVCCDLCIVVVIRTIHIALCVSNYVYDALHTVKCELPLQHAHLSSDQGQCMCFSRTLLGMVAELWSLVPSIQKIAGSNPTLATM